METYHKIQTLFKRDMDGSITGHKGKMIMGDWTTPELKYLAYSQWEFTEKVDGTNIRVQYNYATGDNGYVGNVQFAGRSDNAMLPKQLMPYLEETFTPQTFFNAGFDSTAILFGEGYGPKIQGGGKYRDDHSFVLFDVKVGPWWLSRDDVNDVAAKLGIESVPVVGHGTLYQAINIVRYGTPYLQEEMNFITQNGVPDWLEKGFLKSQWGDFEAEGIVARPVVPLFDRKGERIITKIKAVDFK